MSIDTGELLELLRDIERRSTEEGAGLPQYRDLDRFWEGVVFHTSGARLVVALHEVTEILSHVPVMTRVPGAKPWIKGVSNIRGNLVPIIDLQEFLGGRPIIQGARARVLIVNREGLTAGLLVVSVMGMRHFPEDGWGEATRVSEAVKPYVTGGFAQDGEEWPVFSIQRLTSDIGFQVAAK